MLEPEVDPLVDVAPLLDALAEPLTLVVVAPEAPPGCCCPLVVLLEHASRTAQASARA